MHRLALVVLLVACGKKDESPPKPTDNKTAETKPGDPPPDKAPPALTKPCTVDVKVDGDAVKFSVGATAGSTKVSAIDLSPLKTATACDASIVATDTTSYQTVIAVMDKLVATGIVNVALDDGSGNSKKPPAPPPKSPSMEDMGWHVEVKPDGTIVGMRDPAKDPGPGRFANTPVIVLAKDKATLRVGTGPVKELGESTSNSLDLDVQNGMPDHKTDPFVIIQADKDLPYSVIKKAIFGAKAAGYDNVLFAVKNG